MGSGKPKSTGMSCFGKPKGKDLDGECKASTGVKIDVPEGDINADLPSGDASVTVKTGKLSGKTKSKGLSCFGKPKGTDLDGEYKASADVKLDAPEGEINAELPSAEASIAGKAPELDVKPVKVSGKPKSAGMSCFGKPKGKDLDGEYKASTGIKVDVPEGDINADISSGDASVTVKSPE